jgi:hypothetical protein
VDENLADSDSESDCSDEIVIEKEERKLYTKVSICVGGENALSMDDSLNL